MRILSSLVWVLILSLFSLCGNASVKAEYDLWPEVKYQPSIPSHKEILGYNVGERITNHADMLNFFDKLQQAAPTRIKVIEYARTWEGRKLIYVAIGSQSNIADLDRFAADMHSLADPRLTDNKQAKQLFKTMPASVWLEYGVHGNEISSTDAAMMTAYHLLAAPDDPINKNILENTIVFIDPLQNPDGRERFTSRYYATVGLQHSSDGQSAEHNEPWPNGRSNHYLFDMNRDWLAITQPETAGRVKLLNHYKPLVVIDLHEMGGDQSYYFAPAAQPFNPHMTQTQIDNMESIGRNHAKHFDRMGFDYFTREVFDAFYPGYGDSWPIFYGASASTYEVSSSRGEIYKRNDGQNLTYRNTVRRHFVASISTAEAVANNRKKLLEDFYQYQVSAIKQGKKNKQRVFILPNKKDEAGNHKLATLMAQHGTEVYQATEKFKACGKNYSSGAYIIDTAQPKGRFVTTTFSDQVDMAKAFVEEQERRRARNLRDEIYDVTGWSLPLMFNLETDSCSRAVEVTKRRVKSDDLLKGKLNRSDASIAFIVPWTDMAAGRFLTAALLDGLVVKSANRAFQLDNKKHYPAGSLIIEKRSNPNNLLHRIEKLTKQSGAVVDSIDSSWVIDGPSFGSGQVLKMSAPKIAMAWDSPVSSLSAGNTRFVIEREFNYPVTAIRTESFSWADLSTYQVIILPSGSYKKALGKSGLENLASWVDAGGVLITLGRATRFATDKDVNLIDVKRELAVDDSPANGDDEKKSTTKGSHFLSKTEMDDAIKSHKRSPDFVTGVLANIEVDQEHWLTAGINKNLIGMVYGNDIYTPIKLDSGVNLAWFKGPDELLASGYIWEENKQQLAYKPYLLFQPSGSGMVVGFTQEPTTRAYLNGLNLLLMNSIFRTVAHAQR
jgi:hypothetical protein